MHQFPSVIILSLYLALSCSVYAEDNGQNISGILNSAEDFFTSLKTGEYRASWDLLSKKSRETIVNDVYNSSKRLGVNITAQEINSDFENSGVIANSYWKAAFNDAFNPDIIIKESQWEMGPIDKNTAEIIIRHRKARHAYPARLKVLKENGAWKVGLVETFWTRKLQ